MLKFKCPNCGKIAKIVLKRSDGYRNTEINGIKNEDLDWGWEDEEWSDYTCECSECEFELPLDDTDDDTIFDYLKENSVESSDDDLDEDDSEEDDITKE